jgi:hypothetical protein
MLFFFFFSYFYDFSQFFRTILEKKITEKIIEFSGLDAAFGGFQAKPLLPGKHSCLGNSSYEAFLP